MLLLQETINKELKELFEKHRHNGVEYLGQLLVDSINEIISRTTFEGVDFGPCSYQGDIYFENSEQSWSVGSIQGEGVI